MQSRALQTSLLIFSVACSAVIAVFLIGCGGHDDSHISFWPAYTLANFGDIINYNGEHLEQSSSLLWVVLLALAHLLSGIEISTLGYAISLIIGLALTPVVYLKIEPYFSFEKRVAFIIAVPLILAWQFWLVAGMEMPLYALLLFLMVTQLIQQEFNWKLLAPLLLSLFLVRPETPLVIICFAALVYIESSVRKMDSRFNLFLVISIVLFAVLFVIRNSYFSYGFPLPVYSKVAWQVGSIFHGLAYLIRPFISDLVFLPVGILLVWVLLRGFCFRLENSTHQGFLYLSHRLIIAQLLFVIFSGGDWMRFSRFLMPVLPLMVLLSVDALLNLKTAKKIVLTIVVGISISVSSINNIGPGVISYPWWITKKLQQNFPTEHNYFEYSSREHFSNILILPVLNDVVEKVSKHLHRPPIILSGQMGMTAYYLAQKQYGNFYLYDRYSLVSDDLHNCKGFGEWQGGRFGQMLDHFTLAEQYQTFWDDCGLQRPDILYDIWAGSAEPITSMGYEVIYVQHGQIKTDDFLSPAIVLKGQIIAVDKALLAELPDLKKENFNLAKSDFATHYQAKRNL